MPERVIAGRYRLRRQLGRGSMGIVWEAYDEFLRRPVSVKEVLLPLGIPPAEADELRERTLREARAIAALSHPNVITLHDVAREGTEPFVVTEFLLAHSLAALIRVLGPLAVPQAALVGAAVAAGLGAAHQAGITHRDVKPGNVLIGVAGQVKLTDFGIARNVSERTLTRTGIMLGSPAYIAPEVAAGREVTPAADLWGLGATLFAVVEGRPPYDPDRAPLDTVNQVVHGEVPRPSDGPLAEIIHALMRKNPADRISLAEVRNRLHPLLPPPSKPLLTPSEVARLDAALPADQAAAPGGPPDFQPTDEDRQSRARDESAAGSASEVAAPADDRDAGTPGSPGDSAESLGSVDESAESPASAPGSPPADSQAAGTDSKAPAPGPTGSGPAGPRPVDSTPPDSRPAGSQSPDSRPAGSQSPDSRPADSQSPDSRPADSRPATSQSPDSRPPGSQTPASRPADSQSPDSGSADSQSPDSWSADSQSPDSWSADSQSPDSRPADSQSPDSRPADSRPADSQSPDSRPGGSQSPDSWLPGSWPADSKPASSQSPGFKSAEAGSESPASPSESEPTSSGAPEAGPAPLASSPGLLPAGLGSTPATSTSSAPEPPPAGWDSGSPPAGSASSESLDSGSGSLASTPGPLPFEVSVRRKVHRRRGALANSLLIVVCVVMFAAAAGGGFALARHLGGQPLLPPEHVKSEPTTPANAPPADSLEVMSGDAATLAGAQGGGYQISVPRGWVRFVEERVGDRLPNSTIVYFVSPDGTQTATIERLPRFFPDHSVKDYLAELSATAPDVGFDLVEQLEAKGLAGAPPAPEPAQHLYYRTTASAKNLVPRDAAAQNLNRVTFANLLPYGSDLWVLSVTVPVEQEDSGRAELFDKIAPGFRVTG